MTLRSSTRFLFSTPVAQAKEKKRHKTSSIDNHQLILATFKINITCLSYANRQWRKFFLEEICQSFSSTKRWKSSRILFDDANVRVSISFVCFSSNVESDDSFLLLIDVLLIGERTSSFSSLLFPSFRFGRQAEAERSLKASVKPINRCLLLADLCRLLRVFTRTSWTSHFTSTGKTRSFSRKTTLKTKINRFLVVERLEN